jgi:hypothetical protein
MKTALLSRVGAFAALTLVVAGQSPPAEDAVEWQAFPDHLPGEHGGDPADLVGQSDAMQAALWELIRDQLAPLGLELDAERARPGADESRAWSAPSATPERIAEDRGDSDPAGLATVPEPSVALLGTLGLLLLLRRRA